SSTRCAEWAMPFAWIRRIRWGLRTRMTLFTFVVIAVTLAAAFVWSAYNLQAELEVRNDLFLQHEFVEFVDSAERSLGDPSAADPLAALRDDARVHEETGLFVVIHHEGAIHSLPEGKVASEVASAVSETDLGVTPRTIVPAGAGFGIRAMRREMTFPET